jgi:bifunctional DNase/RNase
LPPPRDKDVLLEAHNVSAMLLPTTPGMPSIPVIVLELEDGREFTLYNVPYEIIVAINKLRTDERFQLGERESIFEVLVDFRDSMKGIGDIIEYVIIDEIDYRTSLYTAKVFFNLGGISITRRMIPSHAIFLALLYNKPIYVSKSLVDQQEELEHSLRSKEEEWEEEEE